MIIPQVYTGAVATVSFSLQLHFLSLLCVEIILTRVYSGASSTRVFFSTFFSSSFFVWRNIPATSLLCFLPVYDFVLSEFYLKDFSIAS